MLFGTVVILVRYLVECPLLPYVLSTDIEASHRRHTWSSVWKAHFILAVRAQRQEDIVISYLILGVIPRECDQNMTVG